jgi:catechol 2,3-dioxygenase-like lactoylglutathione lyase family enzyme
VKLATEKLAAFVPVTDLVRARAFYEGVLGLEVRSADDYGCMLNANGTTLRLARVDAYERPSYTVVGWEVRSIADAVLALTEVGMEMHRYEGMDQGASGIWAAPSGDLVAWFSDSEGNTLSLTEVSSIAR